MPPRESTRFLTLAATVVIALLTVSTGAVVINDPSDPLTDEVALQPGENPYTYLNENNELTIDVTEDNPNLDGGGVNPDAFAAQDPLFYIVYDANTTAEAWIEHDSKAVTFVVDGESIESAEDPLLLTPERERVPVGVEVDTRIVDVVPGDRLINGITVHARGAEPEMTTDGDDATNDSDEGI